MIKMKLILIAIFVMTISQIHSQSNSGFIKLNSFDIELNGNKILLDTVIEAKIIPNVPTDILIYKTNFVSYRVIFTYKFKGRRAKLVRRTYAELPDGKRVYSKQKKDMQELKVSVPGLFKGKCSESILYHKKTMSSIFVSFKYEYSYKN
jgi:hypothetical protein